MEMEKSFYVVTFKPTYVRLLREERASRAEAPAVGSKRARKAGWP